MNNNTKSYLIIYLYNRKINLKNIFMNFLKMGVNFGDFFLYYVNYLMTLKISELFSIII